MKISPPCLLTFAALLAAPAFAQEPPTTAHSLSQHDRDYAVSQLHSTRKMFLDSVAGLTPEQWNFKPAPDRWSVAECAEHIALTEDFLSNTVRDKIMKTPAAPEKRQEVKLTDEQIGEKLADRSTKFKAPEPIAPKKRWPDPADAVAHFKESRDRNIVYLNTTEDDLRNHFMAGPAGMLDAYGWMLFMSGHTERHTLQLLEVKADPNFPK